MYEFELGIISYREGYCTCILLESNLLLQTCPSLKKAKVP